MKPNQRKHPLKQTLLKPENLRKYQWRALRFVIDNPVSALFIDMGLGKTISTLSAIKHLFYKGKLTKPVLLIAPIRVIYGVWRQEAAKWSHTRDLRFSLVHGSARQRMEALTEPAHIYLINFEGVKWLVDYYMRLARGDTKKFEEIWPFGMLVVDESTFFKEAQTQRFKALRKAIKLFERRVILTGTPTPNSLLQLWAQMYIVDMGERLGLTFSGFRDRFFERADYQGYTYKLRPGASQYIERMLRDVVLRLQDSDWLDLPPLVKNRINVTLPKQAMDLYEQFEKEMFLELEEAEVEALNAATLTNRCHQLANGAIYALDKEEGTKDWYPIHDAKLDALREYIEELDGQRAVIAFTFKHDLHRIRSVLPDAPLLGPKNTPIVVEEWKRGKHQFVLAHPQSAGHGVNDLQVDCRRVLFYSIPWSGEHYNQLIARVGPARRSGEKDPTIVDHLTAVGTIDEAILVAQERKAAGQAALLDVLRDYHRSKEG